MPCTDCQMLTGSAFRANIPAPAAGFKLLTGEPPSYIKTADSGAKRRHVFCGTCGNPNYATSIDTPTSYSLRIGTIAERHALTPKQQIWRRPALSWIDSLGGLPASDKG
jgi:hypothetical protein